MDVVPPGTVVGGMGEETRSGRTSNPLPFDSPPSGFRTVTGIVPAVAMSAARILACNWVGETKVVTRSVPFHRTLAPETKSVPVTVRVKGMSPAVAKEGLRLAMAGAMTS